jgi:hypothetical protein
MHLDLSDEEAAALIEELADITGNDRYPFSDRVRTLKGVSAEFRSGPSRSAPARRCEQLSKDANAGSRSQLAARSIWLC